MIGDEIRALREQRCWTQAHLAEASGVSLRTIQRLERLHSCSGETLMAIAAALGVDVRDLSETHLETAASANPLWTQLTPRNAALWGILLAFPAMLFVAVNLLKFAAGITVPYDVFATAGDRLRLRGLFDALSPIVFVGGLLAAILLTAGAQLRARAEMRPRELVLSAIGIRVDPWSSTVLLIAAAVLATLGGYAIAENLPDLLRAAAAA